DFPQTAGMQVTNIDRFAAGAVAEFHHVWLAPVAPGQRLVVEDQPLLHDYPGGGHEEPLSLADIGACLPASALLGFDPLVALHSLLFPRQTAASGAPRRRSAFLYLQRRAHASEPGFQQLTIQFVALLSARPPMSSCGSGRSNGPHRHRCSDRAVSFVSGPFPT